MNLVRIILVISISVFVSGCASLGFGNIGEFSSERKAILGRTNDFYRAMTDRSADRMYKLMGPSIKWYMSIEDRIKYINNLLEALSVLEELSVPEIVMIRGKVAITQTSLKIIFIEDQSKPHIDCHRIIWLRYPDGWYVWEPSMACTYMPDEKEIERLIKNIE